MEKVIEDDDMVVVIVGDDEVENSVTTPSIAIKQESQDESVNVPVEIVLETAVKHGEFIDIKKEKDDYEEYEFLEDPEVPEFVFSKDQETLIAKDNTSLRATRNKKCNNKEASDSFTNTRNIIRKKRYFAPKPNKDHVPSSYIQKLRDENPEFVEHPLKLIKHLANLMRMLRPPKPPPNYCTVNCDSGTAIYMCNFCDTKSEYLAAANRHYQRYHGERYLMCYACGLDFTNTTNLYKHEKLCKARDARIVLRARGRYLGVKGRGRPFTTGNKFKIGPDPPPPKKERRRLYCSLCTASYVHRDNLVSHELTHKGVRPFQCDSCPAAYTSDYALRRHLKTHSSVHKYICDHCGHKTKIKALLVSHMNVHLPLRKYGCEYCPQRFSQKASLQNHINVKHLQLPPPHACPVCDKRYARMAFVKVHMKKIHGLEVITRKMFLQALPTLDVKVLQQAKVVMESEVSSVIMDPVTNMPGAIIFTPDVDQKHAQSTPKTNPRPEIRAISKYKNLSKIRDKEEKVLEVRVPKDDDPDEIDEFLKFIRTKVQPGCKVTKVANKAKMVQCLTSDLPEKTLPRVKMVHNNIG